MPRTRQEQTGAGKCTGGNSYGCHRNEHDYGSQRDVTCYRCSERLGCSYCVQIERDLICLRCRDWGTRAAMAQHGPIVRSESDKRDALKIVFLRLAGSITDADAAKLFGELFKRETYTIQRAGIERGVSAE